MLPIAMAQKRATAQGNMSEYTDHIIKLDTLIFEPIIKACPKLDTLKGDHENE